MQKQYIFFDFDGTLVDTSEGIYHALDYAFEKMGLPLLSLPEKRKYIGPPLEASFMTFNGMSDTDADKATAFFREFYKEQGVKMHRVYDGVIDMLKAFKQRGKKLVIATSKPEPMAIYVMQVNGFLDLFDVVSGATFDGVRRTKEDVLKHAINLLKPTNLEECVLIGDSKSDAIGANFMGMDCVGVLYGFGTQEELEQNGVVSVVDTPEDLLKIID